MTEKQKPGRPVGTKKNGLKYLNEDQLGRFFKAVRNSKNVRDDLMFTLTLQAIKFAFKKYAEEAGLDNGFSVHSLRHSCGILRAKNGDSPIMIQKWLRHRSVTSSQVYFEQVEFERDDERAKETFNKYL